MSDEQPPPADAARRGDTGEDRSARDWVGSEEPEAPAEAGPPAPADEATGGVEGTAGEEQPLTPVPQPQATPSLAKSLAVKRSGVQASGTRAGRTAAPRTVRAKAVGVKGTKGAGGRAVALRAPAARPAAAEAETSPAVDVSPAAGPAPALDVSPAAGPAPALDASPATPSPATPPAAEPAEPPRQVVRATGPPRRPPLLVQGLWPALLAGGLVAATSFGLLPLAIAVLGVQVFLVLGALALLDAPAAGGAFLVAMGTVLVADAVVLADDGRISGLAGVAGAGLVASLLHQLVRKGRSRVTESLADTLVVLVVAVAAACLLALRQVEGGEQVLLVSLSAAGGVLLAGRIGDWVSARPMLAAGSTRGWPGLLLGLGAGVAVAVAIADSELGDGNLPLRSAALLGLVVASTVATADLAVDLGAAELRAGWRDARRVAALRPTALLLPYAVLGPVALLAGRLVLV